MHTSSSFISSNSSVNWSRTSSQVLSEHSDGIAAVSISEEGNRIASCAGGVVRIWDTDEAKLIGEIGESTDMFYAVGISLDGSKVAAAGINKKVLLWDVESGQLEQTLKGHEYWIQSVAFSSSGSKLVSACEKSVRIWNVKTGEVFRVLEDTATGIRVPLFSEVYSARPVAFSPDGIHVAAGGTDKLVKVWNILNRYRALVLKGHTDRIASATFSLDGKLLLSGSWDGTIKAWNWRVSDLPILTLSSSTTPRAIAISPDGNLVASTSKKNVSLWSTNKKEVVAKLEGHTRDVKCIAFLPDGNGLVSGSEDKTLRIWRAQVNQSSPLSPYPSPITGSRGITGDPGPSSARTVERWNQFVPLNKQFTGEYRRSTTEPRAHGGFSSVWICDAMLTDDTMQNVALKELRVVSTRIASDNTEDLNNSLLKRLQDEITVWSRLDHPNIVPLIGFRMEPTTCLISPWYSRGNVQHWVTKHPDVDRRKLMRQVANGLAYLHSSTPPIIHGDIKSDNVLIDDKGNAVIIDFGLGLVIHNKPMVLARTTSSCENGNPRWLAPELYFEEGAMRSMATDVYAFGCLLLEIATGALPFRKLSNRRVVSALASGIPPVSEKEDYPELPENDDLWALMSMCWNREHQARPHMTWIEAILQS